MAHTGPGLSGKEVWQRLLEGNDRFVQGNPLSCNLCDLRQSLVHGQSPVAAVLCCSDSRVPPDLIFDHSLGTLFQVRTAGLVLGPETTGSLEYAVAHLRVPLLVLKGHESCGAVTAAVKHPDLNEGHITTVVQQIAPAAAKAKAMGFTGSELVEAATNNFLAELYDRLSQNSTIIREALMARRLELVLSKYFLSSGRVEVLEATF